VIERFTEDWKLGGHTMLRTIRVLKANSPAFFSKLAIATRVILGLPTPSVQNVTVCYTDLIRNGVLRNVVQTFVKTPVDADDEIESEKPLIVPDNTRAFIHFEDVADPTYVDIFFYIQSKGFSVINWPVNYDFGVYLGHTVIAGPVGGVPYTAEQPAVPVEPPVPPPPPP
jgi:hypothetical protein